MAEIMTTANWAAGHGEWNFWEMLLACVKRGEMEMLEAHKRHNYFQFARYMVDDPWTYVMEADPESLPPMCFVVGEEETYEHYIQMVKDGRMGAWEAAQAYYDEMMTGREE